MANITDKLSVDHRRCDDIFSRAEEAISKNNWDEGGACFTEFHAAMERHFGAEEEVLFPAFEQRTGHTMGPTEVMRMEHTQMRQLFSEMAESVEQKDQARYLGLSETLLMIMQQHNAKEEQMLYRMCDQSLGQAAGDILEKMGMS